MSVSNTTSKAGPYSANGAQILFPFGFKAFSKNDLRVVLTNTLAVESDLTVDAQFTVSLNADQNASPGGTVTTVATYATGNLITVVSNLTANQLINITNFRPDVIEKAFDKLTLLVQQLFEQTSRSVKTPVSSTSTPDALLTSIATSVTNAASSASAAATSATSAAGFATSASSSATSAAASAATALATTTFTQAGTGAIARTNQNKLRDIVSVKDFGAVGDGITDDTTAFTNADLLGAVIYVPKGTYKITANTTFSNNVQFGTGAVLSVGTGITVTFNNGIDAPISQIFSLTGTAVVVFNVSKQQVGFAEWWGALSASNTPPIAAANAIAINASLVALPKVQLMASDYYVSATIIHKTPNHWLAGQAMTYDSIYGTHSTRLLMTDGSTTALQVGSTAAGASPPSQFALGLKTTNLQVARTTAPVVTSNCNAIRVQYSLEAFFDNVRGDDSMRGWEFFGTVSNRLFNCSAKRTSIGTGGTDYWYGFYANGSSGLFAGGNASLYIAYSHADDTRPTVVNGNGFYFDGAFTDAFLSHCETVTCTVGINVQGNSATGLTFSNTDLHLDHCINDAFKVYGIFINNVAEAGSVEIISPYCGAAAPATYGLFVQNSPASVSVLGGQFVMGVSASCTAVAIVNSSGVSIRGLQVLENTVASIILSDAKNCVIEPTLKNKSVTGGAAVQLLNTCTANRIAPLVLGKASGFSLGIQTLGTLDARNEYNLSAIDSGCLAGGAGNKLTRNGVQILATGLSGSNLVSGVMT